MFGPTPRFVILPDLVSYCDIPLRINPQRDICTSSTDAWIGSCLALSPKRLQAVSGIGAGTLASMAYPTADLPKLRVCADFMHWLFHIDDLTDDMGKKDSKEVADIVLDVLHWPERYAREVETDESPALVRLTYDIWKRILGQSSPNVQARFIEAINLYFQAVHEQSARRDAGVRSDMQSYITLRRDDGGAKPSFALIEFATGADLPQWIMEHPIIHSLENAANDVMAWSNDIYSFNKEQARGDLHNLISIAMREKGVPMQEAFDLVGDLCKTSLIQFNEDRQSLPSWGEELDREVAIYVQGLADWIVASLEWPFVSHRYFGDKGEEVREHRVVELLPKRAP